MSRIEKGAPKFAIRRPAARPARPPTAELQTPASTSSVPLETASAPLSRVPESPRLSAAVASTQSPAQGSFVAAAKAGTPSSNSIVAPSRLSLAPPARPTFNKPLGSAIPVPPTSVLPSQSSPVIPPIPSTSKPPSSSIARPTNKPVQPPVPTSSSNGTPIAIVPSRTNPYLNLAAPPPILLGAPSSEASRAPPIPTPSSTSQALSNSTAPVSNSTSTPVPIGAPQRRPAPPPAELEASQALARADSVGSRNVHRSEIPSFDPGAQTAAASLVAIKRAFVPPANESADDREERLRRRLAQNSDGEDEMDGDESDPEFGRSKKRKAAVKVTGASNLDKTKGKPKPKPKGKIATPEGNTTEKSKGKGKARAVDEISASKRSEGYDEIDDESGDPGSQSHLQNRMAEKRRRLVKEGTTTGSDGGENDRDEDTASNAGSSAPGRKRRKRSPTPEINDIEEYNRNVGPGFDVQIATMKDMCVDDNKVGRLSSRYLEVQRLAIAMRDKKKKQRWKQKAIVKAKMDGEVFDPQAFEQDWAASTGAPLEATGKDDDTAQTSAAGKRLADYMANGGPGPSGSRSGGDDDDDDVAGATERSHAVQLREVNGEWVLNEDSLVVDREADHDADEQLLEEIEERDKDKFVNSATYNSKQRGERWSKEETELFFDAITQFGTDFEMISRLFPGRTRKMIKNKWNREEKVNSARVDDAFNTRKEVDIQTYERMTDKVLTGPEPEIIPYGSIRRVLVADDKKQGGPNELEQPHVSGSATSNQQFEPDEEIIGQVPDSPISALPSTVEPSRREEYDESDDEVPDVFSIGREITV